MGTRELTYAEAATILEFCESCLLKRNEKQSLVVHRLKNEMLRSFLQLHAGDGGTHSLFSPSTLATMHAPGSGGGVGVGQQSLSTQLSRVMRVASGFA